MTAVQARRRRRRRRGSRLVLPLLFTCAVFGLGVAVGAALHDNPKGGELQTLVRTLTPLPLAPVSTSTGTVTHSNP